MIITPYSALATQTQDLTEYPALKHFFKCNESTSATPATITDSAGGVTFTAPSITSAANYSIDPGAVTNVALSSGTWYASGTKSVLLIALAEWSSVTSQAYTLGHTVNTVPRYRVYTGTTASNIHDGTTSKSAGSAVSTISTNELSMLGITTEFGSINQFRSIVSDGAYAYERGTAVDLSAATAITTMPALDSSISIPAAVTKLYGIAFFAFTAGLPADLQAGIQWMQYQWQNGRKVIYPGWKGLA